MAERRRLKRCKSIQLLSINSDNYVRCYNKCRLEVNKVTQQLSILLSKKESNFVNVPFERSFIRHRYMLCIDDCETDSNKYALIFDDVKECEMFIGLIQNSANNQFVVSNDGEIFKTKFAFPVAEQFAEDMFIDPLMPILLELIQFYTEKNMQGNPEVGESADTVTNEASDERNVQQQRIDDYESDVVVIDSEMDWETDTESTKNHIESNVSVNDVEVPSVTNQLRRRKIKANMQSEKPVSQTTHSQSPIPHPIQPSETDEMPNLSKAQLSNEVIIDLESPSPPVLDYYGKKQNPQKSQNESKIIKPQNYQFFERKWKGKMCKKLAVFVSEYKKMCYEYTWSESEDQYICPSCMNRYKIHVFAKVMENESGEEFIQLGPNEHKCKLKKFVP